MRNRMMARFADVPLGPTRDADELDLVPTIIESLSHPTQEKVHDASTGSANSHHQYNTATGSASQATILRERINDRGQRTVELHERTKDVYPHELPFPVRTTLEMERVAAPSYSRGNGDTLIMASESAAVVRTLENQLHQVRERARACESRYGDMESLLVTTKTDLEAKNKQVEVLAIRNDELSKQLELLRKECQAALEQKHREHEEARKGALQVAEQEWEGKLTALRAEFGRLSTDSKTQETEKVILTALVKELRDQLQQNAVAMQGHTQTIRQLSNDLLTAKCQASNLSCGLQQKEKLAREAKAELHANLSEMAKVREVAAQLVAEREHRAKAVAELEDVKKQLEMLRGAEVERDRLTKVMSKLEFEMGEKNRELLRLRGQVDVVRQQADQAYAHTAQFHGQVNHGGAGSVYAANTNQPQNDLASLQREIEEEERRTADEARRWRSKQTGTKR